MSTNEPRTCPACGARLPDDADTCDLCGTPVTATDLPQVEDPDATAPPSDPNARQAADKGQSVYCNACGWENPPGARYCSQCGEALQASESAGAKPVDAELPRAKADAADSSADEGAYDAASGSSLMTRQVGVVVGVALLAVVGLFLASTLSQQVQWGDESGGGAQPLAATESGASGSAGSGGASASGETNLLGLVRQAATDSIPAPLRDRIETLQSEINQRSGAERRAKQQELVNLYVGAGQLGQAAIIQRRIAEASGSPDAWRRAGDLLYSWMETLEGQQPASSQVAESVVQAYQNVLDQQPDNLDVRTDMATAYLQTNQPMRGVQEINQVLDADPDHFQARFNKGIMLTMIGRAEEAIQQFERVKEIVGTDSPYYQQANQAIETIQSRINGEGESS